MKSDKTKIRMKNHKQTRLENGTWTPALRALSIEVMDNLILRPTSVVISDPRNGGFNTFQGVREKIDKKKYSKLLDWKEDMIRIFANARASEDPLVLGICDDFEARFLKKFQTLESFSNFQFKECLTNVLDELQTICN